MDIIRRDTARQYRRIRLILRNNKYKMDGHKADLLRWPLYIAILVCVVLMLKGCGDAAWSMEPNCTPVIHHTCSELADAIYVAEGGSRTKHPYGILAHYKHTTPRMACINTIHHQLRNWLNTDQHEPFLAYLARHYAPIGASNDPIGLNKNLAGNVEYYLRRG